MTFSFFRKSTSQKQIYTKDNKPTLFVYYIKNGTFCRRHKYHILLIGANYKISFPWLHIFNGELMVIEHYINELIKYTEIFFQVQK